MREKRVSIINGWGEKLVGIKTIPSVKKEKYPTVILVHGFGSSKEEFGIFDDLARNLAEAGILVFRFDFSGCGESEGDYCETSLSKLKSDLSEFFEFVKLQPEVDVSRIGVLGYSFGAVNIITLEPKAKCLVMVGSDAYPKKTLMRLFGKGYNSGGTSTRVKHDGTIIKLKPQFWRDLENYHLLESIKRIHSPILFIHGEKDNIVPLSQMEECFDNANEPKEKIIIEGADHGLRPQRERVYEIVVEWFKKYLV